MQPPRLQELPAPPAGKTGWPWTEAGPAVPPTLPDGAAWPRVSVVTPSYNQAEFLEETLRSVLLQGYPNLEYWVLDGGSTDGSVEIIRRYEPWLDLWFSGPDGGQAQAIQDGFRRTHGEVLTWLNSDDVFEPDALRQAARYLHEMPQAALVYGNANEIDRAGGLMGLSRQVVESDLAYLLTEDNGIVQPSAFFRRAQYDAVGGLDPTLNTAMDYDLWVRLARLGPLAYVPDVLARTRLYPEAKSSSASRPMFDELRTVAERNGGHGLPRLFAGWLGKVYVAKARAAFRAGDTATGQELLAYALANSPDTRSEATLAEVLADEAWRRVQDGGADEPAAVRWAREICAALPREHAAPASIERRVLGLLYEALAFRAYRQRRMAEGLRYTAQAILQDHHRAANYGLWASSVGSLLRR